MRLFDLKGIDESSFYIYKPVKYLIKMSLVREQMIYLLHKTFIHLEE